MQILWRKCRGKQRLFEESQRLFAVGFGVRKGENGVIRIRRKTQLKPELFLFIGKSLAIIGVRGGEQQFFQKERRTELGFMGGTGVFETENQTHQRERLIRHQVCRGGFIRGKNFFHFAVKGAVFEGGDFQQMRRIKDRQPFITQEDGKEQE